MDDLIKWIKEEYRVQKNLLGKLQRRYDRIDVSKDCRLTLDRNRGEYYIHTRDAASGRGKRRYCNKKDAKLIANVQEIKYLEEAIRRIKINLSAILNFVKVYQSPYPSDVIKQLGTAYRNLDNISRAYNNYVPATEWLRKQKAAKEEHIKQYGEYMPERLRHRTIDKTLTRSKSEVSIYNYLLSKGVTFIYEPVMLIDGEWIRPDFLILTADGRELIIEHLGLVGDQNYFQNQVRKIDIYIQHNWVPNVNLLLTFEDKDGNIDMCAISKMIDAFIA